MYDDSEGLGGRFWLGLIGLCVAGAIAAGILFLLFGWAWYAWGILGTFVFFGVVLIGFGYLIDRREQHRRRLAG